MLRVKQVKINVLDYSLDKLQSKVEHLLKTKVNKLEIKRKSLDARKDTLYYVFEVDVLVSNESAILKKGLKDVAIAPKEEYVFSKKGNEKLENRVVIVGSGPAGLFCSYLLAENGYKPLIIERGEKVEERVKTVDDFFTNNSLNEESNIQFGEGGAGTFSDGKLNTLVKDKFNRGKKVFEILVENGAPKEIMYENKPHIGTDLLRKVIINIRKKIISYGGEFRYNTKLTNLFIKDNTLESIEVNNQEIIPCNVLVLAIGHSARDTFSMLYKNNISMEAKTFAVGLRIEHPQEMINLAQYKKHLNLPPADYKLTYKASTNRSIYSFCMCPGGYVINASSEKGRLVVNGMSNYKRDSKNANSALVVQITPNDFGTNPLDGIAFQRKLEEKAYSIGQGLIPVQLFKDYKSNEISQKLGNVEAITKGKWHFANLNELFSKEINETIKEGITYFGTKIKGFDRDDALLFGIESRTSSPVRIIRDTNLEANIKGIYPGGEGAGYAGGITSAAIDGVKLAEKIAEKYNFSL